MRGVIHLLELNSQTSFTRRVKAIYFNKLSLYLIVVLICLFSPAPFAAQKTNLFFNNLLNELELPNSFALKVLQDSHGYIWAATQQGLYRFDGHTYKKFIHSSSDDNSLPHNYINSLLIDKNNVLWVGSDGGLSRYDDEKESFTNYFHQPRNANSLSSNKIVSIAQSNNGDLWIGTWGGGLNRFNLYTDKFTRYKHLANDQTSLSDNLIYTVLASKDGAIWVGTRNEGLNKLDVASGKFTRFKHDVNNNTSLSHNKVYCITEGADNAIWVGTRGGGVNKFDKESNTFVRFTHNKEDPNSISSNEIFSIFEDKEQRLWVGTHGEGLNLFNNKTGGFIHYKHSLGDNRAISNNNIWSIFQDNKGLIWLGSFGGGLTFFDPDVKKFGNVTHDPNEPLGLSKSYVRALFVDKSGTTWLGMQSGLYRQDKGSNYYHHYPHDPSNPKSISNDYIKAIFEDSNGSLWVGTSDGLNRFSKKTQSFTRFYQQPNTPSSLSDNFIVSLHEDNQKNLWIGTQNGLNRKLPNTDKFVRYIHSPVNNNTLSDNSINDLLSTKDDILWIATAGGVNKFNLQENKFTRYQYVKSDANSLSNNLVFSIDQDSKGFIWFGTDGGLNKLDPNTEHFEIYTDKEGLVQNRVLSVMVDNKDRIWMGELGISLFDQNNNKFINYIGSNAGCFGSSQGANFQAIDGKLFFGIEGYCSFYPDDVLKEESPPTVILTDFLLKNKSIEASKDGVLNKAINYTKSITLSHEDNILSFEFSALDFANSSSTIYKYYLEGFKSNWIETDAKNRRATYTNLPAGKYTFHVKAKNISGLWSTTERTIELIIKPAPWRTWWAYGFYALVIFFIIATFIRLQRQKVILMQANNIKLEKKVAIRTKELNEKNNHLNKALAQLEQLSLTDQLTGAHNRRFLSQYIDQEMAQLKRDIFDGKDIRLGFLLIDADHFKSINDNYGHEAGDYVLVQLVEVLRKTCRATDWIIRWGGEEFVVVTKFNQQSELHHLAERIRHSIKAHDYIFPNGEKINITCSIGMASFPFIKHQPDAFTWQQTMHLADISLYEAKSNGRNTWVSISEKNITNPEKFYQQSSANLKDLAEQDIINYKQP